MPSTGTGTGTGSAGPAGPRGPEGPRGLTGATGPAGPNQINATTLYPVVGAAGSNSTATCLAGDTAISGGFNVISQGSQPGIPDSPQPLIGNTGWFAEVITQGTAANQLDTIQAIAVCFDNPPLRP